MKVHLTTNKWIQYVPNPSPRARAHGHTEGGGFVDHLLQVVYVSYTLTLHYIRYRNLIGTRLFGNNDISNQTTVR